MANWEDLKATVALTIKANGNKEITGPVLRTELYRIIDDLGSYQFQGKATPTTNPGSPDGRAWYLTTEAGTYTNFSGIVVNSGKLTILKWSGVTWEKEEIDGLGETSSFIYTNQSANKLVNFPANNFLVSVDFKGIAGTTLVKIGTTDGGSEVMTEKEINTGIVKRVLINKPYISATDLYITISGGTINISLKYEQITI